ncbi:unnamed protein product [Pedinophyceae sp. YPF-701]|nr:unnamed protein product [Pedinophyceae sp. YPF-701]
MGAYLSAPVRDKEEFRGSDGKLEFGGSAMQGWRRTMEDAHLAKTSLAGDKDAAIFGVFDGHGGAEVARFCQKYMADEVTKLEPFQRGDMGGSLVQAFHRIDEMLAEKAFAEELKGMREEGEGSEEGGGGEASEPNALDLLRKWFEARRNDNNENGDGPGAEMDPANDVQAGCTAVVVLVKGNDLYVANAGDSRAVLCRGGQAIAMSHDHKPSQDREKSRIYNAGGFVSEIGGVARVNANLNLSRAIGDLRYKTNKDLPPKDQIITAEPDIQHQSLRPGQDEFVVMACDGVWDVLNNQQVVDFVRERLGKPKPSGGVYSPDEVSSLLLDRCLAQDPKETRGVGCDNMTCVIVKFKW